MRVRTAISKALNLRRFDILASVLGVDCKSVDRTDELEYLRSCVVDPQQAKVSALLAL